MNYLTSEVVQNKRVLMRVDFNVGLDEEGNVVDDFRIQRTIPTIKFLKENKAKRIVLISHLGEPKEEDYFNEKFSLKPIFNYLKKTLKEEIQFLSIRDYKEIKKEVEKFENGEIILLENIRFYKEEEKNDEDFAKSLASFSDIYINEAFSVSHRQNASLCAITKFLPSYLGFLFKEEIENLNRIRENYKSPFVVILGGAKIKDKLPLIEKFIDKADYLLIGGAILNTILKAWDFEIGNSFYEKEMLEKAKNLGSKKAELILAGDLVVLDKKNNIKIRNLGEIKTTDIILDIGPIALKTYKEIIKKAKTILFNGPLGKIEDERFQKGTIEIIKAIIDNNRVQAVIGGGDTLKGFKILNYKFQIPNSVFLSTGGGAMIKYLAQENLPALECLK
jgi:phosphoglycerate kinase